MDQTLLLNISCVASLHTGAHRLTQLSTQQQSIYDSIRKREIILPEEHQNQVGFEYGWKELLRRTRQSGPCCCTTSQKLPALTPCLRRALHD